MSFSVIIFLLFRFIFFDTTGKSRTNDDQFQIERNKGVKRAYSQ